MARREMVAGEAGNRVPCGGACGSVLLHGVRWGGCTGITCSRSERELGLKATNDLTWLLAVLERRFEYWLGGGKVVDLFRHLLGQGRLEKEGEKRKAKAKAKACLHSDERLMKSVMMAVWLLPCRYSVT